MSAVLDFVCELLRCPSVTPDEAGAITLIEKRLAPLGFVSEREHTPNGTDNAWITHGSGAPLFVFAGHVDVVPPGDLSRWTTPPFEPTVRDGKIYARGASDMKAGVAAAVIAFEEIVRANPDHPGTLALLITSDEEGDGYEGTMRVVESLRNRGVTMDAAIIGEPSCAKVFGDTIKNGRRGSINGTCVIEGKLGHVAYPHLADNPVHRAAPFITELCARVWDNGNEFFGPTTFQISNINAGVGTDNVIPGECTVRFNFRYSTEWTREALQNEVEQCALRHNLKCRFAWKSSAAPFLTEPGALCEVLRSAVADVTGVTPAFNTAGGTSDARFISTISRETVEFGPCNGTIHSINECVGTDEVEKLTVIYRRTFEAMLASSR